MEHLSNYGNKFKDKVRRKDAAKRISQELIPVSRMMAGEYSPTEAPEAVREVDELAKQGINQIKALLAEKLAGPDQRIDKDNFVSHKQANVHASQTVGDLTVTYANIKHGIASDGRAYDIGADMEFATIQKGDDIVEFNHGIENERTERDSKISFSKKGPDGFKSVYQAASLTLPFQRKDGVATYRLDVDNLGERVPRAPGEGYQVATSLHEPNTAAILDNVKLQAHSMLDQLSQQAAER